MKYAVYYCAIFLANADFTWKNSNTYLGCTWNNSNHWPSTILLIMWLTVWFQIMSFRNWLTYLLVYPFSWEWGWGNPLLATAFLSVFKQLDLIWAYVVYGIWNKFLLPTPSIEGRCYMSLNMPLKNLFGSLLRLQ